MNVVPASPGACDHVNVGVCGGLSARILILLQTPFVHLVVKQIRDRRQLITVGALSQSHLWAPSVSVRDSLLKQRVTRGRQLTKGALWDSLGTVVPLPCSRPWDEYTISRLSFPNSGNYT